MAAGVSEGEGDGVSDGDGDGVSVGEPVGAAAVGELVGALVVAGALVGEGAVLGAGADVCGAGAEVCITAVVGAGVGGERGAPATTAPAALGGAMLTEAKASCHVFLRGMLVELTRAVVLTPVVVLVPVVAFRYCHSWTRYAFPIWRRKEEEASAIPFHIWRKCGTCLRLQKEKQSSV